MAEDGEAEEREVISIEPLPNWPGYFKVTFTGGWYWCVEAIDELDAYRYHIDNPALRKRKLV